MRDESMRERRNDLPGIGMSRRCFLHGAVVAVGAASFVFGQRPFNDGTDKPVIPDGPPTADCDCVSEASIPLMAATMLGGKYYGFAGTEAGPQIFELSIGKGGRVSLGQALKLDLPAGFVFGSFGVARGGLAVSGGVPFVLETLDVDYEMTEDVRAAMDNSVPEGIPTNGRQQVEITGVQPAVFIVNRGYAERLQLPDMPRRSFAVATAIARGPNGGTAVLIEHSDGVNESYYASAVDVIEESGRDWKVLNAARELGESGPNFLAADGEGLLAAINADGGSSLVRPGTGAARTTVAAGSDRIMALVPGHGGITALTKDVTGRKYWSSLSTAGRLARLDEAKIENDEIVGATSVSGATGQVVLLGRRSAVLVENSPAQVSQVKGGNRNVM
jgi:hypothetical protein